MLKRLCFNPLTREISLMTILPTSILSYPIVNHLLLSSKVICGPAFSSNHDSRALSQVM